MASGRIQIAVGLNTTDVKKGATDAEKSLEKLEDAVGDAAKSGKQLDKIEDELKDVQRQSKKTGDTVGREMHDGFEKAGDGADEFGREAESTAKESAASFDGSAESIVGAFQEIAANAFAGFGPAGAVAGLAAAAGIGLATAGFQQTQEELEESEARIGEWAQTFIDAGGKAASAAQVAAGVIAIATDPELYKQAAQNAKDWGVDESTALRAMSGDATSLAVVRRTLNDRTEESNRLLAAQETQVDSNAGAAYDLADAVDRGSDSLSKLTGEMRAGADRAKTVSDGLKGIINDADSATVEVDQFGNAVYTLPDGTEVMIDANTKQATTDVSRFKGDVDGIQDVVTTKVKVEVDDYAWRTWQPVTKNGRIEAYVMGTGRQVI